MTDRGNESIEEADTVYLLIFCDIQSPHKIKIKQKHLYFNEEDEPQKCNIGAEMN